MVLQKKGELAPVESALSRKVCYFGTYRQEYSRNRMMISGLRAAGAQVLECHEVLWRDIEDRIEVATGGWFSFKFLLRVIRAYAKLCIRYWQMPDHDVVMLGYPGQLDVFMARFLSWLRGKHLVLDNFMSLYIIATDRNLNQRSPFSIKLLKLLEHVSLRLPDKVIQDTNAYRDLLCKIFKLRPERFCLAPLGADSRYFVPLPPPPDDDVFRVVFYGTFIPNHGVLNIIEAAQLLRNFPDIQFELIGEGPDLNAAHELAERYQLRNINFLGWMEEQQLVQACSSADVLLGSFGTKAQSYVTVHNKIYEGMALGRAVLTGDSPAVREQFVHGEHIFLCKRDNPPDLANAIIVLRSDDAFRNKLAAEGQKSYQAHYTAEKIGTLLIKCLVELR